MAVFPLDPRFATFGDDSVLRTAVMIGDTLEFPATSSTGGIIIPETVEDSGTDYATGRFTVSNSSGSFDVIFNDGSPTVATITYNEVDAMATIDVGRVILVDNLQYKFVNDAAQSFGRPLSQVFTQDFKVLSVKGLFRSQNGSAANHDVAVQLYEISAAGDNTATLGLKIGAKQQITIPGQTGTEAEVWPFPAAGDYGVTIPANTPFIAVISSLDNLRINDGGNGSIGVFETSQDNGGGSIDANLDSPFTTAATPDNDIALWITGELVADMPPQMTGPYTNQTTTVGATLNLDLTTVWTGADSYEINGNPVATENVNGTLQGYVAESGTGTISVVARNTFGYSTSSFLLQIKSGLPNRTEF